MRTARALLYRRVAKVFPATRPAPFLGTAVYDLFNADGDHPLPADALSPAPVSYTHLTLPTN